MFATHQHDYGRTHLITHRIHTGETPPIRSGLRRMSLPKRDIAERQVQEILENGIVEPSTGEYGSPIVLVHKKSGEMHFCVDYRSLKKDTVKDVYPLPRIDDAIDSLAGSRYYSTMDLKSGYRQIEVDPADKHKTAFITHSGSFQFTVMPFGLCNAPQPFKD